MLKASFILSVIFIIMTQRYSWNTAKVGVKHRSINHNNKSTCFRFATGVDMVPYAPGSIENLQKNPGSTSGTVDFASGSILNGRDYAISFVTGDSKFLLPPNWY